MKIKRWHGVHDFFCGWGLMDSADKSKVIFLQYCDHLLRGLSLMLPEITDEEVDVIWPIYQSRLSAWLASLPPRKVPKTLMVPKIASDFPTLDLRSLLVSGRSLRDGKMDE